jgi:transcriptional regulator
MPGRARDSSGECCVFHAINGSLIDHQLVSAMARQQDLVQGTLDMLILKAVSLGPLHGYGILLRIQQFSRDVLQVQQGSLYPALYRLEQQELVTSEWGESENNRRAKFYQLTESGKARLRTEREQWERLVGGIAAVLNTASLAEGA